MNEPPLRNRRSPTDLTIDVSRDAKAWLNEHPTVTADNAHAAANAQAGNAFFRKVSSASSESAAFRI